MTETNAQSQRELPMDEIQKRVIEEVADLHQIPVGAFNFRASGKSVGR